MLRVLPDGQTVTTDVHVREGATITGAEKFGKFKDAWLLKDGHAEIAAGRCRVVNRPRPIVHMVDRFEQVTNARHGARIHIPELVDEVPRVGL